MDKVLFKNVTVLDCTGAAPFPGQVLVEGNRIKAVAPRGTAVASDGAQVVDGAGATLYEVLPRAKRYRAGMARLREVGYRCSDCLGQPA